MTRKFRVVKGSAAHVEGKNEYIPSSSVEDHGVDVTDSVKHIVDEIGTTKSATIRFIHDKTSNTTTYHFSTAETIPSNIKIIVEHGARLEGPVTLTINGPFEAGLYQVFGNSITVSFGDGAVKEVYPTWWPNGTPDGSTHNTTAIQAAVDSIQAIGGTVYLIPSSSNYMLDTDDEITLYQNVNIEGQGYYSCIEMDQTPSTSKAVFRKDSSGGNNVIRGLRLVGPAVDPIAASGDSYAMYLRDGTYFKVENCIFEGFDDTAIHFRGSSGTTDPSQIWVINNKFDNCYRGVFAKFGIDKIHIKDNLFTDLGATPVMVDDSSTGGAYAPESNQAVITENTIDGYGTLLTTNAISTEGVINPLISDNTIMNGGDADTPAGGISVSCGGRNGVSTINVYGPIIADNHILRVSGNGIRLGGTYYADIHDNQILSPGYGYTGNINGIYIATYDDDSTTYYADNARVHDNLIAQYASDTCDMDKGIWVATGCTDTQLYDNTIQDCTTAIDDDGTRTVINKYIVRTEANNTTTGTGEDTLDTITFPADYILDRYIKSIKVIAFGTKSGANGNKTLKLYWGATAITFHAAANNENDWRMEADISIRDSSNQRVSCLGYDDTTLTNTETAGSEDLTGAVELKITGECANAGDTIYMTAWKVLVD